MTTFVGITFGLLSRYCQLVVTVRITSIVVAGVVVCRRRLLLLIARVRRGDFGSRAHKVVLIAACANGDGGVVHAVCVQESGLRCRL